MPAPTETPDFIGRLADAWDGRGAHALRPPTEHEALLRLAGLSEGVSRVPWSQLGPIHRERLVFAARIGVDLGRTCAWCFGARP
jgi:hypothetical protein